MPDIFVGLGSNLGDKKANLAEALRRLGEKVKVLRVSSFYETEPVGVETQPVFLNAVAELETSLGPQALLDCLLAIEDAMGRKRTVHWGPRLIDLDLLFFENRVIDAPNLKIPHPEIQNRRFVLVPLAELAPNFTHPVLKKTVKELLAGLQDKKTVQKT